MNKAVILGIALLTAGLSQSLDWSDYPARTALRITCDTPNLPIYIDGMKVGTTPIKGLVDVIPGWHRVSYFPDEENPYRSILPSDRRVRDIIRYGTVNVLVEEDQILDVSLNYRSVEEEVRAYQRGVNGGRWIGFSLVVLVALVLAWIT